jgi:hypothetical protein
MHPAIRLNIFMVNLIKALIMERVIYQLTIKKEYASAILEDLRLNDAIEFMPESIPQWQQTETLRRLQKMKDNPSTMMDSDTFFNSVDDDAR